jgi:hypothetical protein
MYTCLLFLCMPPCSKVDEAIQNFSPYLKEVAESGAAHRIKEKQLLQHIADNSLLYTDVVTKIGLLDISQTVWQQDKCVQGVVVNFFMLV